MPKLIYKDPDTGSQVVVEINDEMPEVTVGRNPGNIIRINNPSVSRRHTKFVYENHQVTLHDLNSSNGTYVNGMRIQQQVLEDGDLVRVGEFPLDFVDDVEPADTQVEDGQLVEAAQDSPMKSTHMGMGAMGMGGDDGAGGAMAAGGEATEAHEEQPDTGSTPGPGTGGGEPQEFVLGEEDIEEVVESDEVHARVEDDGFRDETVEASADLSDSIQAMQADAEASVERDDDAKTKRADGDALAMQFEQSLEGELSDADVDSAQVEELRQTVAELRAELEKAPDPELIEELTDERDEARRRAEQLEDELDGHKQRLDVAQGDLVERDERIEELQETVQKLRDDLASTDDQLQELKSDNQQLEQQLDDRQQAIEELESRLSQSDGGGDDEALRDELRQKEQQLEELHREVASFDEERQKKKEIFKELSGDLRELVAAKSELEEELKAARSERDDLMEELEELRGSGGEAASAGEQSDEYQALVEEKEALEETLAEVILERDRLEDELQGLRDAS